MSQPSTAIALPASKRRPATALEKRTESGLIIMLKYFIDYLYDRRKEQDQGPRVRAARPDGEGVRQPTTARDPRLSLARPCNGGGDRKRDRPLPGQRLGPSPSLEGVRAGRCFEGRDVR